VSAFEYVFAEMEEKGNPGKIMVRHPVEATKAIVIGLSFFE
jgi:hypothetical protein